MIFTLQRGTRQGDPLSPQILCMEPFAESIRKNKNTTGIVIGKEEHKLALYADDVMVFLKKSLPLLMKEIEKYSSF